MVEFVGSLSCYVSSCIVCANVGGVSTNAGSGSSSWADGLGTMASLKAPRGISAVSSTGTVFVADYGKNRIRMITTSGLLFN